MRLFVGILAVSLLLVAEALAQTTSKNELGLLLGAEVIPDLSSTVGGVSVPVTFSKSVAFQATFAHRVGSAAGLSLLFEVPFVTAPSHHIQSEVPASSTSNAALYITPGFRTQLARSAWVSPWLSFGGGYGLTEGSQKLTDGSSNPRRYRSSGVLQFGGGADFKTPIHILFPLGLRAEVRDFYSLSPVDFHAPLNNSGEHNLVFSGGLVVKF